MPLQNRKFHPISGLWPLAAMVLTAFSLPGAALGQERVVPEMKPRPRVPI